MGDCRQFIQLTAARNLLAAMSEIVAGYCIFCGKKGVTKEHFWPRWLKPYATNLHKIKSTHLVNARSNNDIDNNIFPDYKQGALNRAGDIAGQSLKCACAECNGGWMSRIQDVAKPAILRLVEGNWGGIDQENQRLLSKWIVMFTMVHEAAHRETAVISQYHRSQFYCDQRVDSNWKIWVGRNISSDGGPFAWHSAYIALKPYIGTSQMTVGIFNRLIFLSYYSNIPDTQDVESPEFLDLKQIHNPAMQDISIPLHGCDRELALRIIPEMEMKLGILRGGRPAVL